MKKILLLGRSGFIGKNIYECLKDRYIINAPSRKELNLTDEVEVNKYLKDSYYDVVINSAMYNYWSNKKSGEEAPLENSIKMYYNLEKNQQSYGKMLYLGSGAEFDKRRDIINISEEKLGESIPVDKYGLAKYVIAKSIESSEKIYNLRLFGVYGEYEQWQTKFISNICCKVIKDIPISIRQNVYFDYLYIKDLCKIIEWFINNEPKYKTYNVSSGKKVSLKSIAEEILKISEKNLQIIICKEGLAKEYTSSNKRLMKEISDFKFTDSYEAYKEIYKWYLKNEDIIDLESLLYL